MWDNQVGLIRMQPRHGLVKITHSEIINTYFRCNRYHAHDKHDTGNNQTFLHSSLQ
jgi:hypothetical protein